MLFVHDRFGAFADAESNILATAAELRRRGDVPGLAQGRATGKSEGQWSATFPEHLPLRPDGAGVALREAVEWFQPDVALSRQSNFIGRNLLLYSRQVIRGKSVDIRLEALAQVRAPRKCYVVGDGDHRPFCQLVSRQLGLEGRAHFKSYVPLRELQDYSGV